MGVTVTTLVVEQPTNSYMLQSELGQLADAAAPPSFCSWVLQLCFGRLCSHVLPTARNCAILFIFSPFKSLFLHLFFYHLKFDIKFCCLIKGISPKIHMLCFVLINIVLLNLLCVWIFNSLLMLSNWLDVKHQFYRWHRTPGLFWLPWHRVWVKLHCCFYE